MHPILVIGVLGVAACILATLASLGRHRTWDMGVEFPTFESTEDFEAFRAEVIRRYDENCRKAGIKP